jgi:uncharacterized repeat protein (TIGR03837 family)
MYCDIICQVIDNLGDAGVSWRLAEQLSREYGWHIRFWIDQPNPLEYLAPIQDRNNTHIEIHNWQPEHPIGFKAHSPNIDILITSFCAALHETDIRDLAQTNVRWIHLEYFSCEPWVPNFHLQSSPHPQFNIAKTIWIPSLLSGGGGIIRERTLKILPQATHPKFAKTSLKLFFFTYPQTHLKSWLENLLDSSCTIDLAAQTHYQSLLSSTHHAKLQQSEFVPQAAFDQHLQHYDLVWVRGEDSVLRALLNGIPFVWHIYPQEDDAHWKKLRAFFDTITTYFNSDAKQALWQLWQTWNAHQTPPKNTAALIELYLDSWKQGLHHYVQDLFAQPDLASQLVSEIDPEFKNKTR